MDYEHSEDHRHSHCCGYSYTDGQSISSTGVILLLIAEGTISGLIEKITAEAQKYGIDPGYFSVLIKTIGIAYIAQLGSQICSDAGESAIASKVDLCGRLVILVTVMPTVIEIIEMVCTLLEVNIS